MLKWLWHSFDFKRLKIFKKFSKGEFNDQFAFEIIVALSYILNNIEGTT